MLHRKIPPASTSASPPETAIQAAYSIACRTGRGGGFANPIGRLVLFALIALPMWKGAHHVRHLSLDMGGLERDPIVAPLLYGLALVGNALALIAVVRL